VLCVCKDVPCGCILSIYIYNKLLPYIYIILYTVYIYIRLYTCEWVFDQKIVDFPRLHFFMQKTIVWTRRMLGSCFQTKPMKKNWLWTPVRSKQGGVHWKKLEILCRK
jgi:hypothetical protein